MSKDLLLEIGTEEVPAHAMPGILKQLKENAEKALTELRLEYESVRTLGTPRRTALLVSGLAERQPDVESERRGPSIALAFDADGNPSKAAQGFARGQKIDPKDLVQKDGYVYAVVHEAGKGTEEILGTLLPDLVNGLNFPNNMRWGDLDYKFIRPLRWLVALYDEKVIEFTVADIKSGRNSRGHRFLGSEDFAFSKAAAYEQECEAQFVIVDQEKRRQLILAQIEEVAKANGGKAEINEDLLEEVIYLVEYPTALCGKFEDKYLKLPPEAVITPMRDHQRYFPVKTADGKLLPLFITIRNGGKEYLETVQHGNERVLRARLADAQFFFDEDRKKSLEQHREKLKTVVFQEGLGTIYDKAGRLVKLAEKLCTMLGADAKATDLAKRAALLAKADLVTGMVCEFTELQGIMGREYALLDGEPAEVAQAIDEHYKPRFAGDSEPQSFVGAVVSIADKIDNLVATFSRGLIPTGSQDPFALRRQALGMVNLAIKSQLKFSVSELVDCEMDLLGITEENKRVEMQKNIADFLRLRLKNVLADAGIRYDIADAVLADADDILAVYQRGEAVAKAMTMDIGLGKAIQAFCRVGNLAAKAESAEVSEELFTTDAEKQLYSSFKIAAEAGNYNFKITGDYIDAIKELAKLSAPIDSFFEAVLVMDKDEKIRNNRLALLKSIDELIGKVADFGKIVLG